MPGNEIEITTEITTMTTARKIALFADESLRALLVEQFARHDKFALLAADSPARALALLDSAQPDALLIGDAAPGLVRAARDKGYAGRIILLANDAAPADVDARLPRPFRFADLLALLNASAPPRGGVAIGPYLFHLASQDLVGANGARVHLTEKEAAILARLAQTRGETTARDVLLRDVWGYGPSVATRTLETHIHRLRRKIEPDPPHPRWLLTDPGGYRLAP